jgi:hypothetical protein
MEATKCIVCNTRHWSTQPCPAFAGVIAEERKQQARRVLDSVTKPIPTAVTKPTPETVTKPVTKPPPSLNLTSVTKPNKGGRPRLFDNPLSQAERARRYRERKALQTPSSQ